MNDFSRLLPELRSAMNVTQEDLAKIIGVSPISVSRWENGHAKPKKIIQVRLKKLFDRYDIKTEE